MPDPIELDATPQIPAFARWIYLLGGLLYLWMGFFGSRSDRLILGVTYGTFNATLGGLWLVFGLNIKRLSRRTLRLLPDRVIFLQPLWNREILLEDVSRIRLERMRVTLERNGRPFDLDLSMFTYEQNQVFKPQLLAYLRDQAKDRDIPLEDRGI